jgi:hypothetical protein
LSTSAAYLPHVGQKFRIGPSELVLSVVEPDNAATQRCFTLIFAGAREPVLPEGSYEATLAGHAMGVLYIMPIHTPDRTRQDYQVVFN